MLRKTVLTDLGKNSPLSSDKCNILSQESFVGIFRNGERKFKLRKKI